MTLTVRRLDPSDAEAARRLGWEAFGFPAEPPATAATLDQPGMTWFGAFDTDGRLAARAIDRVYDSCWGGELLPTSGIAGVTVAAEARGRRALAPLFEAVLGHARSRGAVVSALFPTAPGIYRRLGYELVADYTTVEVPTTALAGVAAPARAVTTRRAELADVAGIWALYDSWAIEQNGPLSRRGISFPTTEQEFLDGFSGVTVALGPDGGLVGFVSWNRGQGYDEGAAIAVSDLLAVSADGYRALLRLLGSFATVAPTTRIDTSGFDLARLVLPSLSWRVQHSRPYMLKVLDVPGAVQGRRYPRSITTELAFTVRGDVLGFTDGGYRLSVADGAARCAPAEEVDRVLTPQGLALLYAGAQSCANLRASGHLTGGDRAEDSDLDALFGGRQQHIRDYF